MGSIVKPLAGAVGTMFGGAIGGGAAAAMGGGKGGPLGMLYHENDPRFVDPGPRPEYAKYESIRDPETGLLKQPGLNQQYGSSIANQLDQRGLQAFRDRALAAPGTSPWEQMATAKQQLDEQTARQRAIESGAARAAEGRSALARRGGLSSGASERMARASMRDILGAQQDVARGGMGARADIGLQGEQQRLQALGQLPGMELAQLDPSFKERGMQLGTQQFNIANALAQKQAEEQAKLAEYQEKMKGYAAAQQANAIAASGPQSGGLFGQSGLLGGIFGA